MTKTHAPEAGPESDKDTLTPQEIERLRKLAKQDQADAKKADKKEKKIGGDGAALTVTPEQRKLVIDQYLREQKDHDHDVKQSLWSISNDHVRGPLQSLFHVGLFTANPVAYGTVWGIDKIAQKTISRIPILGQVYEKPRQIVRGTAAKIRDIVSATVTSPIHGVDFAENVYERFTGNIQKEAVGKFEKVLEWAEDKAAWLTKETLNLIPKGANAVQKIAEFTFNLLGMPFRAFLRIEQGVNAGYSKLWYIGKLGHLVSFPLTLLGGHLALSHFLPLLPFPQAALAYGQFAEWITKILGGAI